PLRIALVQADEHASVRQGERVRAFDAFELAQLPFQRVDPVQGVVAGALAVGRAHHHGEYVAGGAVGSVQEGDVPVVAAVGAQLRSTGVEVADPELGAGHEPAGTHHDGRSHGDARV